jgi:TPR repeat protein
MKRMQIAAAAGDALAQFNLGMMYDHGMDDNEHPRAADRAEAMRWFLSAAKQGFPRAQLKLAQTYAQAFPAQSEAPDHRVEAYAWFLRAADRLMGAQQFEAEQGLKRVAATMSEDEIDSARALAERWSAKETYVADLPQRGRRR